MTSGLDLEEKVKPLVKRSILDKERCTVLSFHWQVRSSLPYMRMTKGLLWAPDAPQYVQDAIHDIQHEVGLDLGALPRSAPAVKESEAGTSFDVCEEEEEEDLLCSIRDQIRSLSIGDQYVTSLPVSICCPDSSAEELLLQITDRTRHIFNKVMQTGTPSQSCVLVYSFNGETAFVLNVQIKESQIVPQKSFGRKITQANGWSYFIHQHLA